MPSAISHRPSAICHLPSAICHLPSAICHLPFAIPANYQSSPHPYTYLASDTLLFSHLCVGDLSACPELVGRSPDPGEPALAPPTKHENHRRPTNRQAGSDRDLSQPERPHSPSMGRPRKSPQRRAARHPQPPGLRRPSLRQPHRGAAGRLDRRCRPGAEQPTLGQSGPLTGLQLYTKLNAALAIVAEPPVSAPPAKPTFDPNVAQSLEITNLAGVVAIKLVCSGSGDAFNLVRGCRAAELRHPPAR